MRFFNQSGHEVYHLFDHSSSADDGNDDSYLIVCTQLGETKALHPKNNGNDMICAIFESKSPKVLFIASDSFRVCRNINNRRKRQNPPMVVEAEVHENYSSDLETGSEENDNAVSDENFVLG